MSTEAEREVWRQRRAKYRAEHKEELREYHRNRKRGRPRKNTRGKLQTRLLWKAKERARAAGLEATIRADEIEWPTHCPVLGLELDYDTPRGQRIYHNPRCPSLDRWDNSKGYVKGNVFVVSLRANEIKGNASAEELRAVAEYAERGLVLYSGGE